ncbi:MAG: gliding motility-associated C-terminal domain-containing protein [Burkholderiales bacterium]|nr:gliding motility-associated C-terminal domain-containing protein [Bacteroidia bacterium]
MKKFKLKIFKHAILLFSVGMFQYSYGQSEFYNNGSGITVQSGALIAVQGEVVNTNAGVNVGLIDNSGLISFSGNWTNTSASGALTPTLGSVDMVGANQSINGSQPTRFNNLTLLGSGVKTLNVNTYVSGVVGVLALTSRPLDLNSNTLIVTNPSTGAITRTTGYVISETAPLPGYGIIQWNIANSAVGNYVFPFGSLAANYIPLALNITTPGAQSTTGGISASTYPTTTNPAINNRPLPTSVLDLDNNCNTEHAPKMLDRFWVINTNNYNVNPLTDKQFTYIENEWDLTAGSTNMITESNLQAWHYNSGWSNLPSLNNSTSNNQNLAANLNYGVFTLGEYKQLSMQLLDVDSVVCFGESNGLIQVTSNQGYGINGYYWNGSASPDTIRTNLTAGTYTIIAEDIMGCRDTVNTINVFQPAQLFLTITSNDYSICKNNPIVLTSQFSGGIKPYTVNWSNGASNTSVTTSSLTQNQIPQTSTSYWSVLTDKNNCIVKSDTIDVNVNALPNIDFKADKVEGCQPLKINFTNLSAATPSITSWLWNFGNGNVSNDNSASYTYYTSGTFSISLKATSDSGCINTLTKPNYILVHPKPVADFYYTPAGANIDVLNPEVSFHNTSFLDDDRFWDFGDGLTMLSEQNPNHVYADTGLYNITLIVSTTFGCFDTISLPLKVNEITTLYIPNAFTPNGNGTNDVFTPVGLELHEFNMMIFNRWGEKLFESATLNQGWDGKYGGVLCKPDVYVYKVTYKEAKGSTKLQEKTKFGHVTLIK